MTCPGPDPYRMDLQIRFRIGMQNKILKQNFSKKLNFLDVR